MAWPDKELVASDVDRKTAQRQLKFSSAHPEKFWIKITMCKQHGADQERVAQLSGAALESKSLRDVLQITVRLQAGSLACHHLPFQNYCCPVETDFL